MRKTDIRRLREAHRAGPRRRPSQGPLHLPAAEAPPRAAFQPPQRL